MLVCFQFGCWGWEATSLNELDKQLFVQKVSSMSDPEEVFLCYVKKNAKGRILMCRGIVQEK